MLMELIYSIARVFLKFKLPFYLKPIVLANKREYTLVAEGINIISYCVRISSAGR